MKKILFILMAMMVIGVQNISAQDAPMKIVTNHPDFNIKVKRCAASGKTVILDLILTNEGTNDVENVWVYGGWSNHSEAYDDQGNIYQNDAIAVKVANRKEYSCGDTGRFNIPTGVPMRLSVRIDGVPTAAESIARFKLFVNCSAWNLNDEKPVLFRNIPITRN